jgi:hypothetical protein
VNAHRNITLHIKAGSKLPLYCSECGLKVGSLRLRDTVLERGTCRIPPHGRILCSMCKRNWNEACSW